MAKHKRRKLTASAGTRPSQRPSKKQEPAPRSGPAQGATPTIPFSAEERILLVGEGDLSFARSIIEHHGCYDVVAICFDSKEDLLAKYAPQVQDHHRFIEDEGQTIVHGIDATKLDSYKALKKGGLFERIMFNFPHVGGKSKDVNRQVRFNQELLVKFFAAALTLLVPSGTIIVTLFEGEPYTLWNIRDLARHSGLEVQRSFKFLAEAYPGYHHARTLGNIEGGGGWKGEDRDARTYIFQRKGHQPSPTGASRKRRRDDGSSDED